MARIELDHATKRYPGGVPVVDDLTLDIADGEFMVLVGPSGSGKTTARSSGPTGASRDPCGCTTGCRWPASAGTSTS